MPKLPKILKGTTATFATVEIGKGRDVIQKLIEADFKIPFTLRGYLNPGKGNVGSGDDVGTEFGAETESIIIGKPEFVALDRIGRPWALMKDMKAGVHLQCDGGFECMKPGSKRAVRLDKKGEPYVTCVDGKHYLSGQEGEHGELIGLYKVGK